MVHWKQRRPQTFHFETGDPVIARCPIIKLLLTFLLSLHLLVLEEEALETQFRGFWSGQRKV